MRIRDSEDIIAKDCSGDYITIFETLSAIQKYTKDSIYACSFSFPFTKDFCSNANIHREHVMVLCCKLIIIATLTLISFWHYRFQYYSPFIFIFANFPKKKNFVRTQLLPNRNSPSICCHIKAYNLNKHQSKNK